MSAIERTMLIMFDTKANCNKFYEILLEEDGSVVANYGRVGVTKPQRKVYSGGRNKYFQLAHAKKKKGYKEAQLEETTASDNTYKGNLIDIALKQIKYKDKKSEVLIRAVADANIHSITAKTNITYDKDDGLFKTPLGVVKRNAVLKALSLLENMKPYIELGNQRTATHDDRLYQLNEEYFFLIPNKVKNAREKENLIFNNQNLENQINICNSLLETLDLLEDLRKGNKTLKSEAKEENIPEVFNVEIEYLEDRDMLNKIVKMYDSTKNRQHGHRIMNSKVSNVYKVKLENQQKPFEETSKKIGNVELLWHGTRICNTLSIMSKGLLLPKLSPGQKAGAMFGDGLYFANQSSKSLQYCDGLFWASGTQKQDKIYMFLASVALGNYLVPRGSVSRTPPKGYDSYWAKSGQSGVMNDEIIVFNSSQVRLDYLIEVSI